MKENLIGFFKCLFLLHHTLIHEDDDLGLVRCKYCRLIIGRIPK